MFQETGMNVLALGGCGEMGRYAVKVLMERSFCSSVTIADIDEYRAKGFAAQFPDRAEWLKLDISDREQLKAAMSRADVVMNTVGPFYRYGVSVLSAAIETGRHYLDICDDWEPTLDMLALDEKARGAGVSAVIGMGASPGISNMLAVVAIRGLDEAEDIYTGWDLDSAVPEKINPNPSSATVHGVHQLTGLIRVFENGCFIDQRPIRKIPIRYPGIERDTFAWTIGHPESVTLPKVFPHLRKSLNIMGAMKSSIAAIKVMSFLVDNHILSVEKTAWLLERLHHASIGGSPDLIAQKAISNLVSGKATLPPLFALASGRKNGVKESCGAMVLSAPSGGMAGVTGAPLAAGVALLAAGKMKGKGVCAPEGVFEPEDFFNALAPLCTPIKKSMDDLLLVTGSWDRKTIDWRAFIREQDE
jgi:saccharopine dehydrogenase-like NADP-dependent oxidoreductase